MNQKFDELTRSLARSVTRRQAFKKFGLGIAGMALACFGLANKAKAGGQGKKCESCTKNCLRQNPSWTAGQCAWGPCYSYCINWV
jgi:hypothetical protein